MTSAVPMPPAPSAEVRPRKRSRLPIQLRENEAAALGSPSPVHLEARAAGAPEDASQLSPEIELLGTPPLASSSTMHAFLIEKENFPPLFKPPARKANEGDSQTPRVVGSSQPETGGTDFDFLNFYYCTNLSPSDPAYAPPSSPK